MRQLIFEYFISLLIFYCWITFINFKIGLHKFYRYHTDFKFGIILHVFFILFMYAYFYCTAHSFGFREYALTKKTDTIIIKLVHDV